MDGEFAEAAVTRVPGGPLVGRVVPGRVQRVTTTPLRASDLPVGDGLFPRMQALQRARPWIAPMVILSALAAAVLLPPPRAEGDGR